MALWHYPLIMARAQRVVRSVNGWVRCAGSFFISLFRKRQTCAAFSISHISYTFTRTQREREWATDAGRPAATAKNE